MMVPRNIKGVDRFTRRRVLLHAAAGAALGSLAGPAAAASEGDWPDRPIRLVVPFTPGGANDLIARAAAEGASKVLGQQVIVENRPGAGTTVGAQYVARAAADGYTFLVSSAGILSNPVIRKSLPYREDDLTPVVMIALAPSIVFVNAESPLKDLRELVNKARGDSGLHFATAGMGSTPHFVAELLRRQGARLDVVPYKSGSEVVTAVIGGQVAASSEASVVVLPQLRAGKVRALASTWTRRMASAPDLGTAAEQGFKDVDITHWAGVHAPRGTPDDVLNRMAAAVDKAMKMPDTVRRLQEVGIEPVGGTREEFVAFCKRERGRLGDIARGAQMHED